MLAIIFLIIAGVLIGLFCHWGVLAAASFIVVIVRIAYHFHSEQSLLIDGLMLLASLTALQGGFVCGVYLGYRKDL